MGKDKDLERIAKLTNERSVMSIFVVGIYISGEFPKIVWDFVGVFTALKNALEACYDEDYFIVPMETDCNYESGTIHVWATFPKKDGEKQNIYAPVPHLRKQHVELNKDND